MNTTTRAVLLALVSSFLAWPLLLLWDWGEFGDTAGFWAGTALTGAAFGLLVLVFLPLAGARSFANATALVAGSALIYPLMAKLAIVGYGVLDIDYMLDGAGFDPFIYCSIITSGLCGAVLVAALTRMVLGAPAVRRWWVRVCVAGLAGGAIFSVLYVEGLNSSNLVAGILYVLAHASWQVPMTLVLRRAWGSGH